MVAIPVKSNSIKVGSLFELSNKHISVTSITPDEEGGFIVRMFNPEPTIATTNFNWKELKPTQLFIDRNNKALQVDDSISIQGMGVVEVRLKGCY